MYIFVAVPINILYMWFIYVTHVHIQKRYKYLPICKVLSGVSVGEF